MTKPMKWVFGASRQSPRHVGSAISTENRSDGRQFALAMNAVESCSRM